jgi:hypothetical protein
MSWHSPEKTFSNFLVNFWFQNKEFRTTNSDFIFILLQCKRSWPWKKIHWEIIWVCNQTQSNSSNALYLWQNLPIYLWRKVVCFVLLLWDPPNQDASDRVSLVSLESSQQGGVHGLGSMSFGLEVQKFLNIEWLFYWKFNKIVAENFRGIGMCRWCCWKDLDEQDLNKFIW